MFSIDPQRNLDLSEKTLEDLSYDKVRSHLARRCATERGKELAHTLLPLLDLEEAQQQSRAISEAKVLQTQGDPLMLGGITDLRQVLKRVGEGEILETPELLTIAQTLRKGMGLRRQILAKEETVRHLFQVMQTFPESMPVIHSIEQAVSEQGELLDSASSRLGGLRKKIRGTQSEILRKAQSLLEQSSLASVWQERYVTEREGRYVLPVRAESRVAVRGIVQDTSASGATIFMEPEPLIELNNQWKLAQLELAAEIHRILQGLSQQVAQSAPAIELALKILAALDLIQAAARLSTDLAAHPLTLWDAQDLNQSIRLLQARHPLLLLGGGAVVPNDVILKHGHAMILSGPNAGGKTVALKMTGLFLLMARAGLHCPVEEGSSMPGFAQVLTDIGDDQSLERNVSTFSAHIQNLCQFLKTATPRTLILLDEIAVGTDPEQGAALAQALLEAFVAKQVTVLVTTHYPSLKLLAADNSTFINACVGYDLEHLQPTYRLHLGSPGPSETLPVAQKLGIPKLILDRTQELIHSDRIGIESLLRHLSKQKEELAETQARVNQRETEAEEKMRLFDDLVAEARAEVKKQRQRAYDQTIFTLKETRQQLEELKANLRKKKSDPSLAANDFTVTKKKVDQLSSQISAHNPASFEREGTPLSASEVVPGKEVYVSRLAKSGILLSKEERGKVWVQAGGLKLQVPIIELRPVSNKSAFEAPSFVHKRKGEKEESDFAAPISPSSTILRTMGNTIDLRGERVDAALLKVEQFLDRAMRIGEAAIFVIHGHGTGMLKQAIRTHLTGYPGVKNLESAAQEEGGDGVTIVHFS